jgi:hypothetical protein
MDDRHQGTKSQVYLVYIYIVPTWYTWYTSIPGIPRTSITGDKNEE